MTLTLDLPPDVEGAIAQAAQRQGVTPERLALDGLRGLFVPSAPPQTSEDTNGSQTAPDVAVWEAMVDSFGEGDAEEQRRTLEHLNASLGAGSRPAAADLQRPMRPYDPAAAIAALDSFDQGDAEEQRATLEHLMVALDRNRPGERRIFGEGINPMPPADEDA